MSLYLGENLVSGVALPIEPTRNIGQIIQSTIPLTDAGLHLLDGSVIQGNGIYSSFVNYIKTLYDSGNYITIFETENNWQTSILNYGVCGKFVYTAASGNNPATVRLPKITGFIEGASEISVLGNVVEAGLPNITGTFQDGNEYGSTDQMSGAFYRTNLGGHTPYSGNGSPNRAGFDASLSNNIYGNSSTVQPQTVKVLYYIVIATTTKTNIEVDIDQVVTDLSNKANKDLSNINPSSATKEAIVQWGIPDPTTKVSISSGLFVPPKDGIVSIAGGNNSSGKGIYYGTDSSGVALANAWVNSTTSTVIQYPVLKGQNYFLVGSGTDFWFVAMKGE